MAKKKKQGIEPEDTLSPRDEVQSNEIQRELQSTPFVQRSEDQPAKRRLGFNLTEDGKIDVGSLRGKTKAELADVLKNDPWVIELAGKGVMQEEFPFQFTEHDARLALNVLNEINSFTTRFFFGRFKNFPIDPDVCKTAFAFAHAKDCQNPNGKDCQCDEKVLAERGARLANKYSGEWLKRHAELVMFVGLYFKCVTQQTITAVTLQMQKNEILARQTKPNGHPVPAQRVQP